MRIAYRSKKFSAAPHEAAELFPLLGSDELSELAADVRQQGLLNPIVLHEGKVLDGRNRLQACHDAGVEPRFEEWVDPGCGPTEWVVSQNLHRRHLTASQQAVIALDALPMFEKEAKERMAMAGASAAPGKPSREGSQQIDTLSSGRATEKVGKTFKVNRTYVSDAKSIAAKAPDLIPAIRSGEKTITQAKREIKERVREERREENREAIAVSDVREAEPQARFATIVVDPPWDFSDEGDQDQLGRAKPTYGTMSIAELMDFQLGEWSDTDCHLYLWITNRSLPKGFALMEKWGFRYVTCLTWCKPSIGMGNYYRGSTEQVLFGVKGSQPLKRKDLGTWFAAPRPGKHSAKPTEFMGLVESASPGPYLEVFARSQRDGWVSVGADA